MYSVGLNLYQNINSKRYCLYKGLLEYSTKHGRHFSVENILSIGSLLGYSSKYVYNEIIGCLYANFLINNKNFYTLTERAVRDFALYESETMFKTSEIPYTIDFRPKDIKISFYHLAGMPQELAIRHKENNWSWNRSLNRIMHVCKSEEEVINCLLSSLSMADPLFKPYQYGFINFFEQYGHLCNATNSFYTINMNFRGLFKSKTIDLYEPIYVTLKKKFLNPVDWGGQAFSIDMVSCSTSVKKDFLMAALEDGMIRRLDESWYTLTGHSAVIIDGIINEYHKNRLSVVVRKNLEFYSLWLGGNKRYPKEFYAYLMSQGFSYFDGWFICSKYRDFSAIASALGSLIHFFKNSITM